MVASSASGCAVGAHGDSLGDDGRERRSDVRTSNICCSRGNRYFPSLASVSLVKGGESKVQSRVDNGITTRWRNAQSATLRTSTVGDPCRVGEVEGSCLGVRCSDVSSGSVCKGSRTPSMYGST